MSKAGRKGSLFPTLASYPVRQDYVDERKLRTLFCGNGGIGFSVEIQPLQVLNVTYLLCLVISVTYVAFFIIPFQCITVKRILCLGLCFWGRRDQVNVTALRTHATQCF